MMNFDAIIIGGGIVGAACAFRLSSEGLRIAVVEERFVASGATASGMGHIVVMDDSGPQFALTDLSREIWTELAPGLPQKSEFENCGTIWVAADDAEMEEAEHKLAYFKEQGTAARIVGPKELYSLEPNLGAGLAGGLLVAGDCVVYQLNASKYFIDKALGNGAVLLTGEKVIGIEGSEISLESGKRISAKDLVNAAGIGAPAISPELKIEPKKGHLVITDRYPGFVSHQLIELGYLKSAHGSGGESVAFNVQPRITGQVLIGSSRQPGDETGDIDRNILGRMLQRAFDFLPGLREMSSVRTWTGIRPATPDNLPYIGRSDSNKRVIVAAGHEGLGITTSVGTAELVADEIFGRDSRIPRDVYSPARHA